MPFDLPSSNTAEKLDSDVQQFSVFLKNKVGALHDLVQLLNAHQTLVLALSIQDCADTAIVRLIASDPDCVRKLFEQHKIASSVSNVIVVDLPTGAASLPSILTALLMAEVNIHNAYSLLTRPNGNTALALHIEDIECACAVLQSHNFRILNQSDISR